MMEPRKPWKGIMTPRERFNAQMHYKPFDRTVNMEFGYWRENYQTWDIFIENNIKNEGEADRFFAFEPPACIGGHYEMSPCFEEKILEEKYVIGRSLFLAISRVTPFSPLATSIDIGE